ncbi:MAG: type II toxin-antitoxin system Phd/YefM family antitoxin [Anaerolineales bacterium]|nr:type II toxin-antitoxin system Phd/YefM family antitoxin [Anaerolineales bacterium]NUQ83496.1 type II toxin-antitoxin system Phd/YefM family antitoxin [Anaerolineales bacterium]
MNTIWQLQDAKNKFSEVIERALKHGPQLITRRGKKTVIIMSYEEYARMKQSQIKLSEFFRASPLTKVDLNLKRDKSLPREDAKL